MEEHHTSDSDFVKTFSIVMGALVLFFFVILAAANFIVEPTNTAPNAAKAEAIAEKALALREGRPRHRGQRAVENEVDVLRTGR